MLQGVIAAVLLAAGAASGADALGALQTASILAGLPFCFVLIAMAFGLVKGLSTERFVVRMSDEPLPLSGLREAASRPSPVGGAAAAGSDGTPADGSGLEGEEPDPSLGETTVAELASSRQNGAVTRERAAPPS